MKITCDKTGTGYELIAENGKRFQISAATKNKLGDIDEFVNCVIKYGYDSDQVADYLRNNAKDEKLGITQLNYFFQIAMFIYENNDDIVNFPYLHILNTELSEVFEYIGGKRYNFNEVPVYFRRFYEAGKEEEKDKNKENDVLKYKYRHAVYSLKQKDNPPYLKDSEYFKNYIQVKKDLQDALIGNRKTLVVTIPSSKAEYNAKLPLDHLVRELVKDNDNLLDGTNVLRRERTKKDAHADRNRSIVDNINTMKVYNNDAAKKADSIVVLDDVTTTGHSFIAADSILKEKYNLPIINIAYGRTVRNFYDYITIEGRRNDDIVTAIISDVDNTIMKKLSVKKRKGVDVREANRQIENEIRSDAKSMEMLKYFSSLSEIDSVKVGFISNRGKKQLGNIMYNIFHTQNHILPIEYIEKNDNDYYLYSDYVKSTASDHGEAHYKPSSYSIKKMLTKMGVKEHDRVIGIGNQESDMIAYKNAGIEPVLLNWFNEKLDDHIKIPAVDYNQYGRVFNDSKEFENWLLDNVVGIKF